MESIRNILVPTDFGEVANEALARAMELAKRFDADLSLLHVHALPTYYGFGEGTYFPSAELERQAQKALDEAVQRASAHYPRTVGIFRVGYPSENIVDVARERGCDLIVIGTHGRRGLAHVLLGSVAERVVRSSPVPVMTVGPRTPQQSSARPTPERLDAR